MDDTLPCILFVDDEPELLVAMTRSLRKEPFRVVSAGSPDEAMAVLQKTKVDVVVSDERMPGGSGAEFLRDVRVRYPAIIRIMLTGEVKLETTMRAIEDGELYRFLCKPISPQELAKTLHQALQMKGVDALRARLNESAPGLLRRRATT